MDSWGNKVKIDAMLEIGFLRKSGIFEIRPPRAAEIYRGDALFGFASKPPSLFATEFSVAFSPEDCGVSLGNRLGYGARIFRPRSL